MTPFTSRAPLFTLLGCIMLVPRTASLILASLLLSSSTASAQLFEMTHFLAGATHALSYHAAYDPVHDAYFVTDGSFGQFVDRTGFAIGPEFKVDLPTAPLTPPQAIASPFVASIVYSPDVSDGAGGFGGFVVVWTHERAHITPVEREIVFSQIVSFPGRLVGPRQTVFAAIGSNNNYIMSVDVAYSAVDRLFLVALNYFRNGATPDEPAWMVRLALDGQPTGQARLSTDPNRTCANVSLASFFWTCNVHVAWNPVSQEFGVLYRQQSAVGGGEITLARVRSDLTVVSRTTVLGPEARFSALAVNTTTGSYLVVTGSGASIDDVELDANGIATRIGSVAPNVAADNVLTVSYSPASGTFLFAGQTVTPFGAPRTTTLVELDQHGASLGSALTLPSFQVAQAAHSTAPQWLISLFDGDWIVGTSSPFGGSGSSCMPPDPFTSLGGGVCLNGGWLPRGHPLLLANTPPPPPPPPAPPGACTIPDPFTSLGGGVCVNGGWVPMGHPLASGKV